MDSEIKINTLKLEVIRSPDIPNLLLPGEFGAVLEIILKDKDGKTIERRVQKSQSYLRQMLDLLRAMFGGVMEPTLVPVKNTSGSIIWTHSQFNTFAVGAGIGNQAYGILVGTGNTTPTIDDYYLQTVINHGTGPGQLQYGGVSFGAPASDSTTSQFTVTRDFANASGGSIAVNEIALVVLGSRRGATYYIMTIRDVVTGGIAVTNGQTLTVNYRQQVVC